MRDATSLLKSRPSRRIPAGAVGRANIEALAERVRPVLRLAIRHAASVRPLPELPVPTPGRLLLHADHHLLQTVAAVAVTGHPRP